MTNIGHDPEFESQRDSAKKEAKADMDAEFGPVDVDPIEKTKQKTIPLVESFGPTIQGEGTVIGQQTYFLRFGLCDYKCAMCDSLHAVLPAYVKKNAVWLTQDQIFDDFCIAHNAQGLPTTNWVTFSGGNPAMHDLAWLTSLFHKEGWKINVETQGTQYRSWLADVDSLTISPKPPGMKNPTGHHHAQFLQFLERLQADIGFMQHPIGNYPQLCIKIVVFDQVDLEFAAEIFSELAEHPLFKGKDASNIFYLSLGNTLPPLPDGEGVYDPETVGERRQLADGELHRHMLANYRRLHEDIMYHPVLSRVRFLPQWHTFVWGNDKGK